jgi:hypothetical protein
MSLDNYTNLKKEIIDWSHRDDMDLKIDTFIDLAETQMRANKFAILDLRDFETLAIDTLSTSTRFLALPTNYKAIRSIDLVFSDGTRQELYYKPPADLNVSNNTGTPYFFTVTDQIEFDRVADIAYSIEIQYKADFVPLSDAAPINSILTKTPNIYLFGALWALFTHVEDDENTQKYFQLFINEIQGANEGNVIGQYGPAPVMYVDGPTP